jgi:hypothetical protein
MKEILTELQPEEFILRETLRKKNETSKKLNNLNKDDTGFHYFIYEWLNLSYFCCLSPFRIIFKEHEFEQKDSASTESGSYILTKNRFQQVLAKPNSIYQSTSIDAGKSYTDVMNSSLGFVCH